MSKTILIVEDHPLNMKYFNDILQANGYHTVPITDSREAIDAVRGIVPDLILLDLKHPHVSGLEIIHALSGDKMLCHIPVIVVTAMSLSSEACQKLQVGCSQIISKPVQIKILLGAISEVLSR